MSIEDINFWKINEDIKPFSNINKDIQNKIWDFFFEVESENHEEIFTLFWSEEYILDVDNAEDVVSFILNFWRLLIENLDIFELNNILWSLNINETSKKNLIKIFSKDSNYFCILQASSQLKKFMDINFQIFTNVSSSNFKWRTFTVWELKIIRKGNVNIDLKFNKESAVEFKKTINESLDKMIKDIDMDIIKNKENNLKVII